MTHLIQEDFIPEDFPAEDKVQLFRDALTAHIIATEFERFMSEESSVLVEAGLSEGFSEIVVRNSFMIMGNAGLQQAIAFERCFDVFGVQDEFGEFIEEQQVMFDEILELLVEDFLDMLASQFTPTTQGNYPYS